MNPPTPLFASLLLAWLRSEDPNLIPAMRAAYDTTLTGAEQQENVEWAVWQWTSRGAMNLLGLGVHHRITLALHPRYGVSVAQTPDSLREAKRKIIEYMDYLARISMAEKGA